jgi:amidase
VAVADLADLTAVELGVALREGQTTPVEATEAALRRMEADEDLGAFVSVDAEGALAAARAIAPDDRRLFAGVPTAIKANTPATGLVMDYGSRLLAGHRADHDAHLVRRLREAGFVLVGSTSAPEFGILPTTEPVAHPPARNPWDRERTPGGSSGGSAAAVAARLLPVAHGNDGGGSIRIPAACCGLVGLKPSRGRVSRGPDSGDSFLVCDAMLARDVTDVAATLDVLAGYEAGDATWAPPHDSPFVAAVRRDPGRLRVGVLTEDPMGSPVDPRHVDAVRATADALAGAGHHVDDLRGRLPGREALPLFLTAFAANISLGMLHAQALAGREPGPDDVEPLSRAMAEHAAGITSTQYLAVIAGLQAMARGVVALWADVDLLLSPALSTRPPRIGEITGSLEPAMEGFDRATAFVPFAGLFNVTGQPAISVPAGIGDDGLPLAVQLVGRPLGEDVLLQVARQLEQTRPWSQDRPAG